MATNRTPLEAMTYAKRFTKNFKVDDADIKIRILNAASNRLHLFAAWDWSVAQLTIGTPEIVNGTEDYAFTPASPDDMFGLVRAELYSTSNNRLDTLEIVHSLPTQDRHSGPVRQVCRVIGANNLRLYPLPQYEAGDLPDLVCQYKLTNMEIVETGKTGRQADDSDTTALLFPDEWFWVYEELVLLYAMRFADDLKMGTVNLAIGSNGSPRVEFTGQQAVVREALIFMAAKEDKLVQGIGETING